MEGGGGGGGGGVSEGGFDGYLFKIEIGVGGRFRAGRGDGVYVFKIVY